MSKGGFDISIIGMPELERLFKTLPATVQGKALRPALREAAKDLRGQLKLIPYRKSGRLAASFTIRAMKRSRTGIGIDVNTGTREQLGIPASRKDGGPRGYYPAALEWGRKPNAKKRHNKASRGKFREGKAPTVADVEFGNRGQAPRPFIRETVARMRAALIAKVGSVLTEKINTLPSVTNPTGQVFGGGGISDREVL